MQFFDGAISLGTSPVTAGVATLPLTAGRGELLYTATFTSTDPTFGSSTSTPAVPFVVQIPKPTPGRRAHLNIGCSDLRQPRHLHGKRGPDCHGQRSGHRPVLRQRTPLAPAAPTDATGMATFTTSALVVCPHSVKATFVPTDLLTYNGSSSTAVTVNVQAVVPLSCSLPGSQCTSAQPFTAAVPAGSMVIGSPYTTASPFNLGTLVLNTAGTGYSTPRSRSAQLTSPAAGVTITDTRAGGLGWTASLQSSAFAIAGNAAAVINAGNLGFTEVAPQYIAGNGLAPAPGHAVLPTDNAASPVILGTTAAPFGLASPKTFATAAIGAGSVYVTGLHAQRTIKRARRPLRRHCHLHHRLIAVPRRRADRASQPDPLFGASPRPRGTRSPSNGLI